MVSYGLQRFVNLMYVEAWKVEIDVFKIPSLMMSNVASFPFPFSFLDTAKC